MPTYEYTCDACDAQFELEQRITEKPIKKCQNCGKLKAKRLITQGNFILKGSGWYSDLYSSAKPAASSSKEDSSKSSSDDASEKTKPDKPASSSDSKSSETAKPEKSTSNKTSKKKTA